MRSSPVWRCAVGAGLLGLLLTGCATVQPDARFPAVQESVLTRLGQRVAWDLGGPEAAAVRAAVDGLLARPLAPDAAVQVALLQSSALQAIFEELGVAQADLVQAGLVRNPSLAGFFRFPSQAPWGLNWNLGMDFWPLDVFLVPLRTRLAGAALDAAELRVSRAAVDLAAQARVAFYALWADEQALAAQQAVADLARVAAELADRQFQAGHIDELRQATERTSAQQATLALWQMESGARVSRERLRRVMGLAASEARWTIATDLPVAGALEADAEALLRQALDARPDLAAARKEIERLEYALRLTRYWWLAPVRVGVETERASGGGFQTGPHFEFELPVFDQRQAEVARQEALIRQARRRLADLEAEIRTEVRSAMDRARTAQRIARHYQDEIVPLRVRVTEMTERRYQSMFLGLFEMLSAKAEEATARIALVRAVRDFWTARSDLELALGTRLPEPARAPAR
jgi:outer membrane protein, heavy metal efflux system